jgi:hypothetical protein
MKKIYIIIAILTLLISSLFAVDHHFAVGDNYQFQSISAAITHCQGLVIDNNDNIYITIYPRQNGAYIENIEFVVNANYHLVGSITETVKIQPAINSLPIIKALGTFNFSQSRSLHLENLSFINSGLQNQIINENNSAVYFKGRQLDLINCTFNSVLESIFSSDIIFSPSGSFSDVDYAELNIENCIFNNGTYSTDTHLGYTIYNINTNNASLGINITNSEFQENDLNNRLLKFDNVTVFTFENNTIYGTNIIDNNTSIELASDVYSPNFYIRDNYIKNIDYVVKAIELYNVNDFDFENNTILNCSKMDINEGTHFSNNIITTDYEATRAYNILNIHSSEISGNSFIELNDTQKVTLELFSELIANNLFSNYGNEVDIEYYNTVLANCFDQDFTSDNQITNFAQNLNLKGINNFVDIDNEDFNLEWPSTAIGNGYSDVFDSSDAGYDMKLLTYQDDTIDIGAIPFDQDRKEYKTFIAANPTKNWTGFPAIDNETYTSLVVNGNTYSLPSNNMHVVFKDFNQNGLGLAVKYQEVLGGQLEVPIFEYLNTVDPDLLVSPYQGYRVTTAVDASGWFSGLLQDSDVSISLPVTSGDIWLGFPVTFTTDALVAFDDILGSLQTIKHKDWSLYWTGTEWAGRTSTGNTNLELGDYVEIKFRRNVIHPTSFTWNYYPYSNPNSFRYQDANYVIYEEKSDYTPFFIDVEENSNIEEIALYVDEECIGGAKTQGETTVMVKAFMEDVPNDCEIIVVTFTGAKSSKKAIQLSEYNTNLQVWSMTSNIIKDNRSVYHISLRKDNNSILETNNIVTTNFPNPFNPETTIEFNNPVQGLVNINIYNLKGQLVKNLLEDNLKQGVHKVIWQGRDSDDKQVASGVYFYKISSENNQSVTKKIILMK